MLTFDTKILHAMKNTLVNWHVDGQHVRDPTEKGARMVHSTAVHLFIPCNDTQATLKDFIRVNDFCRSHCRVCSLSMFHHSGE